MSNNFFEIENVSFAAGGKNKVNNVSFSIKNEGDVFCLLGPSGIGRAHFRQYYKNGINEIGVLGKTYNKKRLSQINTSKFKSLLANFKIS